jgi:thioesterase domain-containing protein
MRAQNLGIETLILWDSWTPQAITRTRRPLRQAATELLRRLRAVQVAEQPGVIWKLLQNKFSFLGSRYSTKLATQWTKDPTQLVCKASMQAFEAYRPAPFAGAAILFRSGPLASENILSMRLIRESNGWGGLITGNLEQIELPCDHDTMWKPPMLEVLAEKTANCLQRRMTPNVGVPGKETRPTR